MVSRKGLAPRRMALAVLSVGIVMMMFAAPANAQGFFDFLFGSAGAKPATPAPVAAIARPPIGLPGATEYRPALRGPASSQQTSRASGGARFRTVCVRLCDGYYWPISQDATRSQFYRDAESCRSQCDNEARLFFAPSPGADINAAVDQRGLAYAKLDTAFLYRKQRVAGCVCKPVPWSAREMHRHRTYALEAAAELKAAEADRQALARLAEASREGAPDLGRPLAVSEADHASGDRQPATSSAAAGSLPIAAAAGFADAPSIPPDSIPALAKDMPSLVAAAVRAPRFALLMSTPPVAVSSAEADRVADIVGRHHIEPLSAARGSIAGERR